VVAVFAVGFDAGVLFVDWSAFTGAFFASVADLLTFDVALFTSPPVFLEFGTLVLSPKPGVAVSNAIPKATVRLWIHFCFMTDEPRYFQMSRAKPVEPGNTPGAPNPPSKKFAPQLEIGIGKNCLPFRLRDRAAKSCEYPAGFAQQSPSGKPS